MHQLLVWIADWVARVISDWAHPEAKAERETLQAQEKAQDAAIERHDAVDRALKGEAGAIQQSGAAAESRANAGEKKLEEILKPLPKVERTEDEEFELLSRRLKP